MSVIVRETKETQIRCELARGTGTSDIATGHAFLDHMMVAFARYSSLDMRLDAVIEAAKDPTEDTNTLFLAAEAGFEEARARALGFRFREPMKKPQHRSFDVAGGLTFRPAFPQMNMLSEEDPPL